MVSFRNSSKDQSSNMPRGGTLASAGDAIASPKLRRNLLAASALALMIAAAPLPGDRALAEESNDFSFAVYGDSRSMMYIPYGNSDTDKIQGLVAQLFALILGEKIADEVVKKDVKLTFDPETEALTGWIPARSATVQANLISTSLPSSDRKASTGDR